MPNRTDNPWDRAKRLRATADELIAGICQLRAQCAMLTDQLAVVRAQLEATRQRLAELAERARR